jgi:hypothetical protein
MKVEILDGYQSFGGGGAKRMYGLETGEFSSMIFLMNSFGPHDGKIDPVFLPLPKEVLKRRMWLPKLERKSAGFWDGRSASFVFYWKFLAVVWCF